MSLMVTGSVAIDDVTTPHGSVKDALGGSCVYFSFTAGLFTQVRLVAVVGEDFPPAFRDVLTHPKIDLAGLETRPGSKTFRWTGKYVGDMNEAQTLDVALNVLGEQGPKIPPAFADSTYVFLAATHPVLQRETLSQLKNPLLTVCDTRDLWIENERAELETTLMAMDGIVLNDGEARQLTGKDNLIRAGRDILKMGPRFVIIKKGEHGAMLVVDDDICMIPSYPTADVVDPTGAGDSFAGGMMGYLDSVGQHDPASLKRAMACGTVAASFAIESFSLDSVRNLARDDFDTRHKRYVDMLKMD